MTRSRSRNLAFGLLALVAVALSATAHSGPSNERVTRLRTICESPIGVSRRAALMEELLGIGTGASRSALTAMAASKDDKLAAMAIATIGRGDYSGARAKLKIIYEDTKRTDGVRCAALAAWCRAEKSDSKKWKDVSSYVNAKAGTNQRLQGMALAIRGGLFGEGGR